MTEDSPAKPLLDLKDKIVSGATAVRDFIENLPPKPPKQDTSWHDQQVREANESFRKQAASEAAAKKQGHSYKAAQAEHAKMEKRK